MARFDVYRESGTDILLLDCQADVLADELPTRFVVPLLPITAATIVVKRLNPTFEIAGVTYVMTTQLAAAVPAAILAEPLTSLVEQKFIVGSAIDVLLGGV